MHAQAVVRALTGTRTGKNIQMKNPALILLLGICLYGCSDSDEPKKQGAVSKTTAQRASPDGEKPRNEGKRPEGKRPDQAARGQGAGGPRAGAEGRRPGGGAMGGRRPGDGAMAGRRPGDRMAQMRGQIEQRPVPVAVAKVQRGRVDAFYATTASLSAAEEASVVARTQGVVQDIFVEEGDIVTAGEPLAQLDTTRLALEVDRTRTNIESFDRAHKRARQLLDTSMISPEVYDQALYNLERENATLALQLYEMEEATIRAPIAGVITLRHIKLGNTLSPNSPAFELKQADSMEAVLNVPEKELIKIKEGQLAIASIDALNDRDFEGVVERIAPEVDASSGTFRVTVALDNTDNLLKPGMFVRVNVRYDSSENTLLVNREAVVTQKDENTVFVVRDGLAMRQFVELGYAMGGDVEILNGLDEGDEVIVTGQNGLKDGTSVRVVSI